VALSVIFLLCTGPLYADSLKGPWDRGKPQEVTPNQADQTINPLRFLVRVYRSTISPIDGKTCPMYPSCSDYSLMSFKKHGFLIGWIMTCDRLFRCGRDELNLCPEIMVNGVPRCYDPLENNDFWWYHER
jgi:putative membrane protein insertion efficiency factor